MEQVSGKHVVIRGLGEALSNKTNGFSDGPSRHNQCLSCSVTDYLPFIVKRERDTPLCL